ncbi:MAG TPA: hydrogenase nickel incorporation protein HypB [Caldimonas sp.]
MCVTCGCGEGQARIEGAFAEPSGYEDEHEDEHAHGHEPEHAHGHEHAHEDGHVHSHAGATSHSHADPATGDHEGSHWHRHVDGSWHDHDHSASGGATLGAVHAPDIEPGRRVRIERDILARNDAIAAANRRLLAERGIFALNLVSSPGSGKTTLLVKTIEALRGRVDAAVIEGDQQTTRDADRIRASGAPAIQINTGKGCHLDADMVSRAIAELDPAEGSLLLVENVGNLVCPAAFDLGEAHKVVILSVTEGDDKPLKYPDMFHAADLLLVNKVDLLPHVDFDVDAAIGFARRVQPDIEAMRVSATTGEGFEAWLRWLERGVAAARAHRDASVAALQRRIAELETELGRRA